jgi:hypothetical protein
MGEQPRGDNARSAITEPAALAALCTVLAAEWSAAFGHHVGVTTYGPASATSPPPIQCTVKLEERS